METDIKDSRYEESTSYQRRIVAYPSQKTCKDIKDYCALKNESRSELTSRLLKEFFERNPRETWRENKLS